MGHLNRYPGEYDPRDPMKTMINNLAVTIDYLNSEFDRIDASIFDVDRTYRINLLKDSSTAITVGDRRKDKKVDVDYIIQRGPDTIEDGRITFLNLDPSVTMRKTDVEGNAGYTIEPRITIAKFLGDPSIIGGGGAKWANNLIFASNNKMYGIPGSDNRIIEFDPTNDSVTFYDIDSSATTGKWTVPTDGDVGVPGNNGKIYGMAFNDDRVIEFDPETNEVNYYGDQSEIGRAVNNKWLKSVLIGNKIFGIPGKDGRIIEFNTDTKEVKLTDDILGSAAAKYNNATVAPNGNIYCIPATANQILEIIPTTSQINLLGDPSVINVYNGENNLKWSSLGVVKYENYIINAPYVDRRLIVLNTLNGSINFYETADTSVYFGWDAGVVADNDKIYYFPYRAGSILEFNPADNSINLHTHEELLPSSTNAPWRPPIKAANGKLYGVPSLDTRVIVFNPADGSINFIQPVDGSFGYPTTSKFAPGILATNGKIYAATYEDPEKRIIEIDPETDTVKVITTYPLSDPGSQLLFFIGNESPDKRIYFVGGESEYILEIDTERRDLDIVFKDTSTNNLDSSLWYTITDIKI